MEGMSCCSSSPQACSPPAGAPCRAVPVLGPSHPARMPAGSLVLLSDDHDYFFVLYVVYFAAQGWLAVLALAHYPGEQDLDPLPENISLIVYEVPLFTPSTPVLLPKATCAIHLATPQASLGEAFCCCPAWKSSACLNGCGKLIGCLEAV